MDEAAELLEKIAALNDDKPLAEFITSSRGKARMRAIHHLSGGNPRLYLILSDFLTKESLDNLVRLFEETVDRQLTPYFQERMRWLSPQQQEIVQFLCQQAHPASVKAISEGIFTKQNTVSGQLKQLREKGYLVAKGRGKESLYELAEPLMRLSFQVKEMNHRQPLNLIVDFMRVWYDRQDLEKRLEQILPGTWGRDYFEVAIHKIDTEGNAFRHSLMLACMDDIDWQKCDTRQLDELRGIAEETDSPKAWFKYGYSCLTSENFGEGIRAMSQLTDSSLISPMTFDQVMACRATCHLSLGNFDDAIADYTAAVENPKLPENRSRMILYWRANVYYLLDSYVEAIADLNRAIKSWNGDAENLANALLLRGKCRSGMEVYEEALSDFGNAVEMAGISEVVLAEALAQRAFVLCQIERHGEAIIDCEKVLAMPGVAVEPFAQALNVRAIYRIGSGDPIGAKNDLDLVCSLPECPRFWLASAYFLRSALLRLSGKFQEAVADLSSTAKANEAFAPNALLELAKGYLELYQYEQGFDSVIRLLPFPKISNKSQEVVEVEVGTIITNCAYGLRETPEKWMLAMKQILPLLVERNFTTGLSTALVRHLEKLKQSDHNNAALNRWVSDWENVSRDYPGLQVGIRMLRAGVEWIKTTDDGALLDLVKEERVIVRQALGLEPESDE
ncbi:MAG: tetratricopeptide repeat protein [Luteolibacter sp.]